MFHPFSLLIGLGASLGLIWVAWQSHPRQSRPLVDTGLIVLVGALVAGRGGYVSLNWPYFQSHPWEIPQVWLGGFSGLGALAGGLLTLVVAAWLSHQPPGPLVDAMLPLLTTLAVSAWIACWREGCAYGSVTAGWWGVPARDEWGILDKRQPVQILGALLTLGLFWGLERVRQRLPIPGTIAGLGVTGLCLIVFVLSFLRADPIPIWRGLRLDAWAALAVSSGTLLALTISFFQARSHSDKGETTKD